MCLGCVVPGEAAVLVVVLLLLPITPLLMLVSLLEAAVLVVVVLLLPITPLLVLVRILHRDRRCRILSPRPPGARRIRRLV